MLTYKEQLKQMSDIGLAKYVVSCDPAIHSAILEAELFSRLNRNPMDENCGNCEWREKLSPNCNFISCCNEESKIHRIVVDSTIRCTFFRRM